MTNVKIQKTIAILISLMTMCTLFNLISKNSVTVSADWSSVAELENYALANWTKPIQASYADINTGSRYFGANRSGTTRKHAANDYVCAVGTPVYAMTGGYVEEFSSNFYGGTQAISVKNDDGSVARYCEIKTSFRSGDRVEKGQQIGTVIANNKGGGHMLHLEMYLGTASGSLTNTSNSTYWYVSYKNYCRRQDLIDPSFTQKLGNVPHPTDPPTYAKIDKNQIWYDLQDTIELYPTSDKATDFWLTVKKDDTVIKSEHVDVGGSLKFYAGDYGSGNYYAWTTAYNSAGGVDSDGIDFSIIDGVGYSYIGSSQSAYRLSDEVSIKVDTICAKGQVIGIDRIGDGRVITESCDSPYTIPAKNLGTGLYGTYFSVYNGSACVDTKWDFFSIDNETEKPANVSLKADKDWYDADDNITLSPSSTNASVYWICIRKNGSDVVNQKIIGDYTFNATEYGCGEYYAWISAVNSCGATDSSGVTFSIVQSASYEDAYSEKDVYDIEDMVSLTVEPLFAEGQALHIDNAETGENILYVLSDETYRIEANKLGKGKFIAYFTVYNGTGSSTTPAIEFEIIDSKNLMGDCNNDGKFTIADVVMFQKWLLSDGTVLVNWKAADLYEDDMLNVFDLALMKKKLWNSL